MTHRMGAGIVIAAGLLLTGCKHPEGASYQVPIQSFPEAYHGYSRNLVHMSDNAMLHDMSINDVHFIPHTTELSGAGVARLVRMARLLNTYGGTVRYETFERDTELVNQRLDHVREFLASTDCDMERVAVKPMISGGRGMRASDSIENMVTGTGDAIGAAMSGNSQAGGGKGEG